LPNPASRWTAARSCSNDSVTTRQPSWPGGSAASSTDLAAGPNTSGKASSAPGEAASLTWSRGLLASNSADQRAQNPASSKSAGRSKGSGSTRAADTHGGHAQDEQSLGLIRPQAAQREPVAVHQPAAAARSRLGDDRDTRGAERLQVLVDRPDADPQFGGERSRGRRAPGLERQDLRRDGRYALHSETCPPPRQDDGFTLAGLAREVADATVERVVRARVLAERDGTVWPGFDEDVIFELAIERALLTLTKADGPFPAGPTIWKEGNPPGT